MPSVPVSDTIEPTIFLRPEATWYEYIREYYHSAQYRAVGKEAFRKLPELEREQYVYDRLISSGYWARVSLAERNHVITYINKIKGSARSKRVEQLPKENHMTQQRAIHLAVAYLERAGIRTGKLIEAHLQQADELYGPQSGESDTWVVRFDSPPTHGVAVECPSSVIIDIDDRTGEASQFDAL